MKEAKFVDLQPRCKQFWVLAHRFNTYPAKRKEKQISRGCSLLDWFYVVFFAHVKQTCYSSAMIYHDLPQLAGNHSLDTKKTYIYCDGRFPWPCDEWPECITFRSKILPFNSRSFWKATRNHHCRLHLKSWRRVSSLHWTLLLKAGFPVALLILLCLIPSRF